MIPNCGLSYPARAEQRVADLRESGGGGHPGFHRFKIGGEPEPEKTGYYEFDPERECYVNEHGHTVSADDAPDSEFDYTVEFAGDEEAETHPTGEAAIREALSGISDEEADQ